MNFQAAFDLAKVYAQVQQTDKATRLLDDLLNNTSAPLTFGDSSNAEMCFTGMYRWPAGGTLFDCAN